MKTIAICNQKGGVGKTTTCTTLANGLRAKGYRCLIVDAEGQRNATKTSGADTEGKPTLYEVLKGEATVREAITKVESGDIIAGNEALRFIEAELKKEGVTDLYTILKKSLKSISKDYDFAIIDTPPALNMLTLNALVCSDFVIVPTVSDFYSFLGLRDLADAIRSVKAKQNKKLKVAGVLLTMHNSRQRISKSMADAIERASAELDTTLYKTTIRHSVKARESQFRPEGLLAFKSAPITADYMDFVAETLERIEA